MLLVHIKDLAQYTFLVLALYNLVHKAMLQQKFCPLKSFRQLLTNGLLDDSGACKTNEGVGLRQDNIAQHGKTCGNASGGWVCQHADKQLPRLVVAF